MSRSALALLTASALVAGLALGLALAPRADARAPRSAPPVSTVEPGAQRSPADLRTAWTPVPVIPAGPMGVSEPDPAPGASPTAATKTQASPSASVAAARVQPDVESVAVVKAAPRSAGPLRGKATWFRAPDGTAAAGPALRAALGKHWRGSLVDVCSGVLCVQVRLLGWCACPGGRVIDLAASSFDELAPLGRGVIRVAVARS